MRNDIDNESKRFYTAWSTQLCSDLSFKLLNFVVMFVKSLAVKVCGNQIAWICGNLNFTSSREKREALKLFLVLKFVAVAFHSNMDETQLPRKCCLKNIRSFTVLLITLSSTGCA